MSTAGHSPYVVDTNVPVTANGRSDASPGCVVGCVRAVRKVAREGHILVDEGLEIYQEHKNHLSPSGQPGPGDAFFKWLLTNLFNPGRCTRVPITPKDDDASDFVEFPDSRGLAGFDPSDRKFVAVAVAHGGSALILQATDSQWWGFGDALSAAGVNVEFLCPEEIAAKHAEKYGKKARRSVKRGGRR